MILIGVTNFCNKYIGKEIHWTINLLYFNIIGLLMAFPMSYFIYDKSQLVVPNQDQLQYILYLGGNAFFNQFAIILAFLYAAPIKVVLCASTSIVFAFLYDYFLYDFTGNAWSLVGSVLILSAVVSEFVFSTRLTKQGSSTLEVKSVEIDKKLLS